jgi:hypothetical protein
MTLSALTSPQHLGDRTAIYQVIQTATQQPVAIQVPRCEYPSFSELVQFCSQYAYAITPNLPISGTIHLAILTDNARPHRFRHATF